MQAIFELHIGMHREDFSDEQLARKAVEDAGHGYIVTFYKGFDGKDRSGAMNVYKDGKWNGVDISQ